MPRHLLCLLVTTAIALPAVAGEYNPVLDIGDAAPAWKDLPGVDGKTHSLADLKDQAVIVVSFTCNSCPYAVEAEDRTIALAKKYADKKVAVIAINVNKVEEDLLPAMKEKAKAKAFRYAYLFDASQQIAKDFGASYTPEFFVLNQKRQIVYMGSFDDSPDGSDVKTTFVTNAIDAVLAGKTPKVQETVAVGCRVRYENTRRRRRKKSQ